MNKELENLLCSYLGELMYQLDHEYDWILKEEILKKIDAVNILLGTEAKEKRFTYLEKVMEAISKIPK